MDLELDGKVAIVTGGARGIGAAIARRLAAERAKVCVLDRNRAEAERLAGEVRGLETYAVDLTESAKLGPVVNAIRERFGRIDILVNNAGANDSAGLTSPLAHFRASLETNLVQCFLLVQLCKDHLANSRGAIVNIGSKVAVTGQGGTSGYVAAKGALHALTREWALELAPNGVRVNAIVPAEVRTPLYERWLNDHEDPAKAREQIERLIPLGHRLTHPEEIADAVAFVASPRASHLTGQLIFVDGGYTHLDHAGLAHAVIPCVDSHVHFWDGAVLDYPWLKGAAGLGSRYLPDDYARAGTGGGLETLRLVFVEADCDAKLSGQEVSWIESLAARGAPVAGLVAQARLDEGERSVEALAVLKRSRLVKGVRHMLQYAREPGYCAGRELIAGARRLAETGLVFDLCCREDQLEDVISLVRACPETSFVLDHAGKPSRDPGAVAVWQERIARLSESQNVVCKFSGMSGLADPALGVAAGVRPYFEHLLARFGSDRLLYGSDWPVVDLTSNLPAWQAATVELLRPLALSQQRAILHDNALRVYHLN